MSHLAILLVLLSALLITFRDFQTKTSRDKQVFVWWISFISLFLFIPSGIYTAFTYPPDLDSLWLPCAASFIHCAYWIFYSRAYDQGDFSQIYPIVRSTPLVVLIFAIVFLHEELSTLGVLGILLTSIGVYLITFSGMRALQKKVSFLSLKDSHIRFAFGALLMTAGYSIVDKIGIGHMNPLTYAAIQGTLSLILFTFYLIWSGKWTQIAQFWKNHRRVILGSSVFTSFNYPLLLFAMSLSQVSYVVSLRQVSVVLAVMAGGQLLKEQNFFPRFSGSLLIFTGAILISLA